jgi:hypothetical protein
VLDEPDPERQLRLNAHNSRLVKVRAGAMLEVIRSAAPGDADILRGLNHPALYALLAGERGWSPERYEQWLGDLLCAQLLGENR